MESFMLCSFAGSFPIEYVSQGFQELFGLEAEECLGKPCGQIIGCTNLARHPKALDELAVAAGIKTSDIAHSLGVMNEVVSDFVKNIAQSREEATDTVLALNCKGTGDIFVCEMALSTLKEPVMGWSYAAGFQRDVSHNVPASKLLKAASEGTESYKLFLASLAKSEYCLTQSALQDLHTAMKKRWFDVGMNKLTQPEAGKPRPVSRSITSVSTSCSCDIPVPATRSTTCPGILSTGEPLLARSKRFLDLLEALDDTDLEDDLPDHADRNSSDTENEGTLSAVSELLDLRYMGLPLLIADPFQDGVPILSNGFRRFNMSIHGPESMFEDLKPDDALALRKLLEAAGQDTFSASFELIFEAKLRIVKEPCMVHIMQVQLDDFMSIIGVYTPGKKSDTSLLELDSRMDVAIAALARNFFLSAPLRRQIAQRPSEL